MNAIQKEVAMALIAVVNDDADYLEMMRDLLEDLGYQAFFCTRDNGAYDSIKQHRPDLILADIRMERPDSGIRLVEQLRQDPETQDIPVIVVTADIFFLESHTGWAHDHNCAILTKPFLIEDLEQLINAMLPGSAG